MMKVATEDVDGLSRVGIGRQAEKLLANCSVEEVANILESSREQINRSNDELREFIGLRYHDLLESSDTVAGMHITIDEFKTVLNKAENDCRTVIQAGASLMGREDPESELKAVDSGSQGILDDLVSQARNAEKLIGGADMIWRYIDTRNLEKACEMYYDLKTTYDWLKALDDPVSEPQRTRIGSDTLKILELDEFSIPTQSQANSSNGRINIWKIFPFLRSNWNAIVSARDRIIKEANTILSTDCLDLQFTSESLRALVFLRDKEPQESLDYFLCMRADQICFNYKKGEQVRSMQVAMQTMVDVFTIYIKNDDNCAHKNCIMESLDPALIRRSVTDWLIDLGAWLSRSPINFPDDQYTIASLESLISQFIACEESGDTLVNNFSHKDASHSWRDLLSQCIDSLKFSETQSPCTLFSLLFADSVVQSLLQIISDKISQAFDVLIWSMASMIDIDLDSEKFEKDFSRISSTVFTDICKAWKERVLFEDDCHRMSLAFLLGANFLENLTNIQQLADFMLKSPALKTRESQVKSLISKSYEKCFVRTVKRIEFILAFIIESLYETDVAENQNPASTPGNKLDDLTLSLKHVLFVARVSQAVGVCADVFQYDVPLSSQNYLQSISATAYDCFAKTSRKLYERLLYSTLHLDGPKLFNFWSNTGDGWNGFQNPECESGEYECSLSGKPSSDAFRFSLLLLKYSRMINGNRMPPHIVVDVSKVAENGKSQSQVAGLARKEGFEQINVNGDDALNTMLRFFELCEKEFSLKTSLAGSYLRKEAANAIHVAYNRKLTDQLKEQGNTETKGINQELVLQFWFDLEWMAALLFGRGEDDAMNLLESSFPDLKQKLLDYFDSSFFKKHERWLSVNIEECLRSTALVFSSMSFLRGCEKIHHRVCFKASRMQDQAKENGSVLRLGVLSRKTLARIPQLPIGSEDLSIAMPNLDTPFSPLGTNSTIYKNLSPSQNGLMHSKNLLRSASVEHAAKMPKSLSRSLFSQENLWPNRKSEGSR